MWNKQTTKKDGVDPGELKVGYFTPQREALQSH